MDQAKRKLSHEGFLFWCRNDAVGGCCRKEGQSGKVRRKREETGFVYFMKSSLTEMLWVQ